MNDERLQQALGEPYDFFAMRAFLVALGKVDDATARAMIHYISDRGFHELIKRKQAACDAAGESHSEEKP